MIAIPLSLTLMRLILGPIALWAALHGAPRGLFAAILVGGLLSDYFDGVLARRFGVAKPWFRRLDSTVDIVFYIFIAAVAYVLEAATFQAAIVAVALLIGAEIVCISVSLIKFRTLPGTHCYSAKIYGLVLFICSLGVLSFGWGPWALWLLCAFGLIAYIESLAVILLSKESPVDIPSVFVLLRRTA